MAGVNEVPNRIKEEIERMNKYLILGIAAGLGIFGMGMLPAIMGALDKQNGRGHVLKNAQPQAGDTAPCSPSPTDSPGTR